MSAVVHHSLHNLLQVIDYDKWFGPIVYSQPKEQHEGVELYGASRSLPSFLEPAKKTSWQQQLFG